MKITRRYIMDNRTDRGAWTQAQIEALGLTWPPEKGWIDRVCGEDISTENQALFESKMRKSQYKKYRKKTDYGVSQRELWVANSYNQAVEAALKRHNERKATEQLDREEVARQREWL